MATKIVAITPREFRAEIASQQRPKVETAIERINRTIREFAKLSTQRLIDETLGLWWDFYVLSKSGVPYDTQDRLRLAEQELVRRGYEKVNTITFIRGGETKPRRDRR
jgi:hypothetical protein